MSTPEQDERWRVNHAAGMAAAKARTEAHRIPGPAQAELKRRNRERHPCKVKGCKRTAYKGAICKAHWATIPVQSRIAATVAVMAAQRKETEKWHRRFLRELNAKAT